MNTNNITELIPGINLLPPKWQGYVVLGLFISPYVTRALYALRNQGGLKGVLCSIWLGTNTPKAPEKESPKAVD